MPDDLARTRNKQQTLLCKFLPLNDRTPIGACYGMYGKNVKSRIKYSFLDHFSVLSLQLAKVSSPSAFYIAGSEKV